MLKKADRTWGIYTCCRNGDNPLLSGSSRCDGEGIRILFYSVLVDIINAEKISEMSCSELKVVKMSKLSVFEV